MARRKREKITYEIELHLSINEAEAWVNRVIKWLGWEDKWPPTLHRTRITATEPERTGSGPRASQWRTVIIYFTGLPYATAEVMVWKWGEEPWFAGTPVTFTPNPDLADQEPQLANEEEITVTVEDGELRVYSKREWRKKAGVGTPFSTYF